MAGLPTGGAGVVPPESPPPPPHAVTAIIMKSITTPTKCLFTIVPFGEVSNSVGVKRHASFCLNVWTAFELISRAGHAACKTFPALSRAIARRSSSLTQIFHAKVGMVAHAEAAEVPGSWSPFCIPLSNESCDQRQNEIQPSFPPLRDTAFFNASVAGSAARCLSLVAHVRVRTIQRTKNAGLLRFVSRSTRGGVHRGKKPSLRRPHARSTTDACLVAGTGFEPVTFGL